MNLRSHFYSKFANDHRIVDLVKLKCCAYCEKCNSLRTMKCSRITLFDRKEIQTKNYTHKHPCYYERTFQPQLENYLSWLNKPYNVFEEEQPYLTVCNLALPNNAMVFVDRGAQSDRWVHKRPRLRSAMQKNVPKKSLEFDEDEIIEPRNTEDDEEEDTEIMEIQQVLQEYEIDENVQRLIQEAADYDRKIEEQLSEDHQKETYKRKHKKHKTKETGNNTQDTTTKEKEKAKVRLNRTMTVSLSRPPSPETIQVIRVDVTSNYSMEELNHRIAQNNDDADCDDDDDYDDDDDDAHNEQNSDDFYEDDEQEQTDDDDDFQNERLQTGNEKAHAKNQQLVDNNAMRNRLYSRKTLMKIQGFSAELAVQCQKLALANRRNDVN